MANHRWMMGMPPLFLTIFLENVSCDLDLWIHAVQNLISWWFQYKKQLCLSFGSNTFSGTETNLYKKVQTNNHSFDWDIHIHWDKRHSFNSRIPHTCWHTAIAYITVISQSLGLHHSSASLIACSMCDTDTIAEVNQQTVYPLSGLPSRKLNIKLSAPVMLLRNTDPVHGHGNGTCDIVRHISRRYVTAHIAFSEYSFNALLIPCIPLSQTDAGVKVYTFSVISQ